MTLAQALAALVGASGPFPPAAHPRLSAGDVREIRQMFRARAGFSAICRKFGVTEAHVRSLCIRGTAR
jgi:hypothetical protein